MLLLRVGLEGMRDHPRRRGLCGIGGKEGGPGAEDEVLAVPRLWEWCSAELVAGLGLFHAEVGKEGNHLVVRVEAQAEGAGIDG
jgi:hypothetical protein